MSEAGVDAAGTRASGRRRMVRWLLVALAMAAVASVATFSVVRPFPPDTTPEGAYLRIAKNIGEGHMRETFAYLETDAQWASYTIRDTRRAACARVRRSYPDAEAAPLLSAWGTAADAPDGADVFAAIADRRGWFGRLSKDLSGVARVEVNGPRATVVTTRGTRYSFRVRENGIWGLTLFTADLMAEAERASRDLSLVESAAADFDRERGDARDH
jgi:hypothetical protein